MKKKKRKCVVCNTTTDKLHPYLDVPCCSPACAKELGEEFERFNKLDELPNFIHDI